MAVHLTDAAAAGLGVHGLRFLNDEWNDSISNGQEFTLRWNQSLSRVWSGLGVFKVTYPKNGVVVYELISNLTDGDSCRWTPNNLEKKSLYAMWLTASPNHTHPNWTLSPPWIPKSTEIKASPWAAPFIIPVVCLIGVYAASLTGYLVYRRRKKARREQEDATPHQDVGRNDSVDSGAKLQELSEIGSGHEKRSVVFADHGSDADVVVTGAVGDAIDRSDLERAISSARRGHSGTIERRGNNSLSIDLTDDQRARSNVRRGRSGTVDRRRPSGSDNTLRAESNVRCGRSGTAEGRGRSDNDRNDSLRAGSSVRRERSGTTDSRGLSALDRYDIERAQGNVRRGRSGTAERLRPSHASTNQPDLELPQSNIGRGRSATGERSGIRLVLDSSSRSGADEEADMDAEGSGKTVQSPSEGQPARPPVKTSTE